MYGDWLESKRLELERDLAQVIRQFTRDNKIWPKSIDVSFVHSPIDVSFVHSLAIEESPQWELDRVTVVLEEEP